MIITTYKKRETTVSGIKSGILPAMLCLVMLAMIPCSNVKAQQKTDNKLSKKDKALGYQLLFDGQTLNGWRGYKNQSIASWSVDNGVIHCRRGADNYGAITADLCTIGQYENFDLSLDWKISPQGNSGILYLVTEEGQYSFESGPEYQIIDDVNFPEKLEDWQHSAANYAMNPAPDAKPNPAGEWNHARIVKKGNHVEHWLNGKKVVAYQLHSDAWNHHREDGKWKDYPLYGKSNKGFITFQNHGSEVWFKNIKIRVL